MNTNYGPKIDNKKSDNRKNYNRKNYNNNTNSSSHQDVNPYWPKALVLKTAVNRRPEQSKPAFSLLSELSKALKSKLIRNDSKVK
jgi:hypothetical protein